MQSSSLDCGTSAKENAPDEIWNIDVLLQLDLLP